MPQLPESKQKVKFYQTGTFTVGNRLLEQDHRTVQATIDRSNSLDSGHRPARVAGGAGRALRHRCRDACHQQSADCRQRHGMFGGVHHALSGDRLVDSLDSFTVRQRFSGCFGRAAALKVKGRADVK